MSRFNNPAALLKPGPVVPAEVVPAAPVSTPRPPVTSPSAAIPAPEQATDGVLGRIAFASALAYLFIRFSLTSEAITVHLGFKPYLAYLTGPLALLGVMFTGQLMRVINFTAGKFFCGFMVWLLIAAPFSVWKGGSFQTLTTAFEADFSMFFMIICLTTTWDRFRLMLLAIAAGGVCDLALCLAFPSSVEGRFVLAFGTMENPNDLATHLLVALPFIIYGFLVSARFSLAKLVYGPAIIGILMIVLRTGSRSAFLSLIGIGLYMLFRAPLSMKITLVAAAMILVVTASLTLPADMKWRYLSLFSSDVDAGEDVNLELQRSAAGSEHARKTLLTNSVSVTFQNPIFGVGPGEFAAAEAATAKELGKRAGWQVTHNAYTQVSAEAGIPALIFFAGALFGALRMLFRIQKNIAKHGQLSYLMAPAFWLLISGIGLSINIFFSALAYSYYVPVFIALTISLAAITQNEARRFSLPQIKF